MLSSFSINDEEQDIVDTYGVKFVIFENCMLILSTNRPYFITHIFKNILKYKPVGDSNELEENLIPKDLWYAKIGTKLMTNPIESILFRVMQAILAEIEPILIKLNVESVFINQFALELSHHERIDFVTRLHMVKSSLTSLMDLVHPKKKVLKRMKESAFFSEDFKVYLKHLESKVQYFVHKIKICED